ncbi:hypothetical protein [Mannheimia massilioguelmaensis]|uniref:hypothetical protein n=1 Tax=Mannheimia massilioguelmaensis TaxID=1604354 RepID=UPI00097C63F9|nr:hypothetical protein [Mannheimia massilioguelmaensis]
MKKYRLIESDKEYRGQKLYQIQALRDFTTSNDTEVKAGDLGGFLSGEHNLSHEGNCWVANSAEVRDKACVSENGYVGGCSYLNDAVQVFGNACITRGDFYGEVKIYDNATVYVKGTVCDEVEIFGNAEVGGKCTNISGAVKIFENAVIGGVFIGDIKICDNVQIYGNAQIEASCCLKGNAEIYGNTRIAGKNVYIQDNAKICGAEITGGNRFKNNVQIVGQNIVISGGVSFAENAKIINTDEAQRIEIGGDGRIAGNAFIRSQNDFIQSKIFSDFLEYFIAYKTENGIEIRYNNQSFSPEQVRKALSAYTEYEIAIQVAKSRILGDF